MYMEHHNIGTPTVVESTNTNIINLYNSHRSENCNVGNGDLVGKQGETYYVTDAKYKDASTSFDLYL